MAAERSSDEGSQSSEEAMAAHAGGAAGGVIDVRRSLYPHCIVWTPIPCLTWLLPFIGHMGICDSRGAIHDFAGPYTVSVGQMAFGEPTRYLRLAPPAGGAWDDAVRVGDGVYAKRMHNLCCDNCHSHVARCLDTMHFAGFQHWNMVILAAWMFCFMTWFPFLIIVGLILVVKYAA